MVTVMPQTGSWAVVGTAAVEAPFAAAARSGRRRRATISARMLTAISSGVTAPRSSPAGAFSRRRRSSGIARAEGLDHDAGPRRARDQAHVVRLAPERLLERVLVEPAMGRHHDGGPERHGNRRQVADDAGAREARRRR